ncbi:hypothetical protein SFRURICE_008239 [Spodoptera frugiperda]|nr:hypothetical protein SFRURICE_008239 [Spodoptera frugiperda]
MNMIGGSQTHVVNSHMLITEINVQLALFRDLLIHIGQPHDCPELRERVRRLRRACVEATKTTSQLVLPNCKNLAESVSTSAKLCVPMNIIGGYQTHPQQHTIAHLWWKSTLDPSFNKTLFTLTVKRL